MKKNLMFIIGQLRNGGSERVISNLCNDLKDDYNITLIVRSLDDADSIYIPDVNIIEVKDNFIIISKIFSILKIRKIKKKLKIDTTISFHLKYNVYNYFSKYKDKVIVSIRNYETYKQDTYTKIQKYLYKKVLKKVDLIVNVSQDVMKDQMKIYKTDRSKNIVIPNYVNLEKINELKHKNKINSKSTIITAGRLVPQKNTHHLISAMKYVKEYNKDIKLLIFGRGPLKDEYLELINELNLEKNIKIMDFNNNIYKYMNNSKLFVLTSLFEGMPNVLLEALACDLPIIATDCYGGTKEILSKDYKEKYTKKVLYTDYGVLVPNFINENKNKVNERLLGETIIRMIKDKKSYKKYKSTSSIRAKDFSKEKILPMWKDII